MGQTADTIFNASSREINILSAWIGAVSYMLQIYYDFSGYSDMAIGLGKIFGFEFQENFKYPYVNILGIFFINVTYSSITEKNPWYNPQWYGNRTWENIWIWIPGKF